MPLAALVLEGLGQDAEHPVAVDGFLGAELAVGAVLLVGVILLVDAIGIVVAIHILPVGQLVQIGTRGVLGAVGVEIEQEADNLPVLVGELDTGLGGIVANALLQFVARGIAHDRCRRIVGWRQHDRSDFIENAIELFLVVHGCSPRFRVVCLSSYSGDTVYAGWRCGLSRG